MPAQEAQKNGVNKGSGEKKQKQQPTSKKPGRGIQSLKSLKKGRDQKRKNL